MLGLCRRFRSIFVLSLSFLIWVSEGRSSEVLYFGDSQAALWTGRVIGDIFETLPHKCQQRGYRFAGRLSSNWNFIGYATGSSSFRHWIAKSGSDRSHLCGAKNHSALILGKGVDEEQTYEKSRWTKLVPEVCKSGSVAKAVLKKEKPRLVVAQFMGNSAWPAVRKDGTKVVSSSQWGWEIPEEFEDTEFDLTKNVKAFIDLIPKGVPCVIMTSNPNRLKESVQKQRMFAQAVIERDVTNGARCAFMRGMDEEIQAVFEENSDYLGDKFHMSTAGTKFFFEYHEDAICSAVKESQRLAR